MQLNHQTSREQIAAFKICFLQLFVQLQVKKHLMAIFVQIASHLCDAAELNGTSTSRFHRDLSTRLN